MDKENNLKRAQAIASVVAALGQLHDKGLIDDAALAGLSYRFARELVDVDRVMGRGKR